MGGKAVIKLKKLGSQGCLLPPMLALQNQLIDIIQGPVSCELDKQYRQQMASLGDQWGGGVSPDRSKAFFTQIMFCPMGGADKLIIDIWNLKTLTLEQQFCFEDLAAYVSGSNTSDDGTAINYQNACFLGNEHIIICTMTGYLYLLSVITGEIVLKKKVGNLVESVTSCFAKDIFAVSIFPGTGLEEYWAACGVKIFTISAILKKQELELIEFISYGLGEPPFSILPNKITFSRSGERLLFRGAAIRDGSYTDYVEVSDVTNNPAVTIHERDNKKQVVKASISANHHTVLIDCESVSFFDQNQDEISRFPLPGDFEGGCRNCLISDDGSQALAWLNGVVYLFAPGKEPRWCFAELGYVLDIGWLDDDEIIAFLSCGDSYTLCRINLNSMAVNQKPINFQKQIEEINPQAVAVSHDGRLFIGDRQANLRSYGRNLILEQSVKMTSGPINQLVADRFQDRIAVLMASQELKILSPKDCTLKTYISRSKKTPILAGYGVKSTNYPLMEAGELIFNLYKRNTHFQCDDYRSLYVRRGKEQILVRDGHNSDTKNVGKFSFHSPVMAVADCHRHVILALADGSLMAFNPYHFELDELESGSDDKLIAPEGDHIITITKGFDAPLGLAATGPGRVVLWTEGEVVLFDLDDDFSINEKQTISQSGVKNVVYDAVSGRIILVMSHYLSLCSEDLKEMYRLTILSNGRSIIEVPYPEKLTNASTANHPGFFWSADAMPPDPALFSVLDSNGQVIEDVEKCRDFLEQQVFNEFMVREATFDYQGFLQMLEDAARDDSGLYGCGEKTLRLPISSETSKADLNNE